MQLLLQYSERCKQKNRPQKSQSMSARALAEKHICVTADAPEDAVGRRQRGVATRSRLWPAGRTICIHFLNGTVAQRQFVERIASLWLPHINLSFLWNVARVDSDVRVRFRKGGSWSYLGTDNLSVDKASATMNFGWLPDNPGSAGDRGLVLHEFGHMLGFEHEHQSPRNKLTWITDAVVADLAAPPNEWSMKQIERNVLFRYSADDANVLSTDSFDAQSVMTYSFPPEWNEEGVRLRVRNSLSSADKRFARQLYPFADIPNGDQVRLRRFWSISVANFCSKALSVFKICC